jgi:hypothetical protein
MARRRKTAPVSFSPAQAVFILERATADRKLSRADVRSYLAQMGEEISSLEARLASLRHAAVDPVKRFVHKVEEKVMGGDQPFPLKKRKKRVKRVSAEVAASRKLQGQYLSLFRQIPKTKRPTYQKLSKAEGREAAVAAMKKALGK